MVNALKQHLIGQLGHNIDQLDTVIQHFTPITTKRNEFLVREGEICKHVYFIVKGCVQILVLDHEGHETTRDFYFENNWVSQLQSFGTQTPSTENLVTPEPSELLAISYSSFGLMMQSVPQFAQIYQQILELSFNNSVYRINTFVSMDALDRIKWLMQHQPNILSRLPSKLVASYLGISPETLTRLKAKL